jgi:hypothetical protein
VKLLPKDDGRYNLEPSKQNRKYIRVRDIQIEQTEAIYNTLHRMKSVTRDTDKVNLHY